MTMTGRLQASFGLLLALAIAGGLFVTLGNNPNSVGMAEAAKNLKMDEFSDEASDCAQTGTCGAESMYKDADASEEVTVERKKGKVGSKAVEEPCEDHHDDCERWATIGECTKNEAYMLSARGCRKSCLVCGEIEIDMGMEQTITDAFADKIQERLKEAEEYLMKDFGRDPKKKRLLELCKNKHQDCALWAVKGE